jgi:hypothetical protein
MLAVDWSRLTYAQADQSDIRVFRDGFVLLEFH